MEHNNEEIDILIHLPLELSVQIIGYLSQRDMGVSCMVSKAWREFFDAKSGIWTLLYKLFFNGQLHEPHQSDGSFKTSFVARYLLENNWKNATFKLSRLEFPNASTFFSVRIAPDNETVITGSETYVQLFHIGTKNKKPYIKEKGNIGKHAWMVWNVQFTADSQRVVSCGYDKTVRMWNINPVEKMNRKQLPNFDVELADIFRPIRVLRDVHENNVWDFKLSSDDKTLFTCGGDGFCKQWDFETGQQILSYNHCNNLKQSLYNIRALWDKNLLISGSQDCTVKLWDFRTDQPVHVLKIEHPVYSLESNPLWEHLFITGNQNGGIEFWDMRKAINSSDYSSIHKMASVQLPGGSEEYCMRVDSTKFFCSAHRQYILQCDMFKILQDRQDFASAQQLADKSVLNSIYTFDVSADKLVAGCKGELTLLDFSLETNQANKRGVCQTQ
jgi:WD40 repeat protein